MLELSRYDPKDLTPEYVAAFRRLDLMDADTVPRVAMYWLENGANSEAIAILAGETNPTLREHGKLLDLALLDMGAPANLSREEAYWKLTQFLLTRIAAPDRDPFPEAEWLITKVHCGAGGLALFTRTDLPPLTERNAWAGEELGLERVVGAVFALDDFDHGSDPPRVEAIMCAIKEEAARALSAFYTIKPAHFQASPA